jgi:hypothetical protein
MSSRSSACGGGDRDRLLAGALHVEAGLALPLGAVHAVVEDAHRDFMSRSILRSVSGVELRVPRADRLALLVEHAERIMATSGICGERRGGRRG